MPHLLSLNSYHYRRGGSDVVYFDHAALFEEKGWEVSYFSMEHPRNLPSKDTEYFTSLVDYEYVGGPVDKLRTAAASVYNFEARRKLKALLKDRKIDVAHVHCIYHHLTPAVFQVLAEEGIPVILTAHDLKIVCPAYKMMNAKGVCEDCKDGDFRNVIRNRCIKGSLSASSVVAAEAWLHRALGSYEKHLSKVVAPSRFYRDKIVEWGYPQDKVTYIPNFTRDIDQTFAGDYDGACLFFGRLSEEKGLSTLIEASRISGVPVDIIGTGPLENDLREQARGAPVQILGRQDGDALWSKVGGARAVVLPSEWYENAPMSVLEAFQLGRPVLGADIAGIPELINSSAGSAGWLYESKNAQQLAERLVEVANAPVEDLAHKGQVGRKLALSNFSKEHYFDAMMDIYNTV